MTIEGAPQEKLKQQIGLLNTRLSAFAEQGGLPDMLVEPTRDTYTVPSDCDFTGFLNHYLSGSCIGKASAIMSEIEYKKSQPDSDEEFLDLYEDIGTAQRRTIRMTREWLEDPKRNVQSLERKTLEAVLDASTSFHWVNDSSLLTELNQVVRELGDSYSLLYTGKKLI